MVKKRCKVCKKIYTLGVDGIVGDLCDKHAGVKRDKEGYIKNPMDIDFEKLSCQQNEK